MPALACADQRSPSANTSHDSWFGWPGVSAILWITVPVRGSMRAMSSPWASHSDPSPKAIPVPFPPGTSKRLLTLAVRASTPQTSGPSAFVTQTEPPPAAIRTPGVHGSLTRFVTRRVARSTRTSRCASTSRTRRCARCEHDVGAVVSDGVLSERDVGDEPVHPRVDEVDGIAAKRQGRLW